MNFAPKHILVPIAVDPDADIALAASAVDTACVMAEKFSAKLTLFYVAEIINAGETAGVDISGQVYRTIALVVKARLSRGRTKLKEFHDEVAAKGIDVDSRVHETEEPLAHAICNASKELGCDLIIIGSRGRAGLKRMFLGSVAERVVHLSPVPVLLLHPLKKND